jgi:hypothetical protein
MRSADVLMLLHGEEPICEEYIPSKLYEYLWMQRPILAMVHCNPQMAALVREQGYVAILTRNGADHRATGLEMAWALEQLFDCWQANILADNERPSAYTTDAAVLQMLTFVKDFSEEYN